MGRVWQGWTLLASFSSWLLAIEAHGQDLTVRTALIYAAADTTAGDYSIRVNALKGLQNLAQDPNNCIGMWADPAANKVILQAAGGSNCGTHCVVIQTVGLSIISQLALCQDNKAQMVSMAACRDVIMSGLASADSGVAKTAFNTLATMATDADNAVAIWGDATAQMSIIQGAAPPQTANAESVATREKALVALATLASHVRIQRSMFTDADTSADPNGRTNVKHRLIQACQETDAKWLAVRAFAIAAIRGLMEDEQNAADAWTDAGDQTSPYPYLTCLFTAMSDPSQDNAHEIIKEMAFGAVENMAVVGVTQAADGTGLWSNAPADWAGVITGAANLLRDTQAAKRIRAHALGIIANLASAPQLWPLMWTNSVVEALEFAAAGGPQVTDQARARAIAAFSNFASGIESRAISLDKFTPSILATLVSAAQATSDLKTAEMALTVFSAISQGEDVNVVCTTASYTTSSRFLLWNTTSIRDVLLANAKNPLVDEKIRSALAFAIFYHIAECPPIRGLIALDPNLLDAIAVGLGRDDMKKTFAWAFAFYQYLAQDPVTQQKLWATRGLRGKTLQAAVCAVRNGQMARKVAINILRDLANNTVNRNLMWPDPQIQEVLAKALRDPINEEARLDAFGLLYNLAQSPTNRRAIWVSKKMRIAIEEAMGCEGAGGVDLKIKVAGFTVVSELANNPQNAAEMFNDDHFKEKLVAAAQEERGSLREVRAYALRTWAQLALTVALQAKLVQCPEVSQAVSRAAITKSCSDAPVRANAMLFFRSLASTRQFRDELWRDDSVRAAIISAANPPANCTGDLDTQAVAMAILYAIASELTLKYSLWQDSAVRTALTNVALTGFAPGNAFAMGTLQEISEDSANRASIWSSGDVQAAISNAIQRTDSKDRTFRDYGVATLQTLLYDKGNRAVITLQPATSFLDPLTTLSSKTDKKDYKARDWALGAIMLLSTNEGHRETLWQDPNVRSSILQAGSLVETPENDKARSYALLTYSNLALTSVIAVEIWQDKSMVAVIIRGARALTASELQDDADDATTSTPCPKGNYHDAGFGDASWDTAPIPLTKPCKEEEKNALRNPDAYQADFLAEAAALQALASMATAADIQKEVWNTELVRKILVRTALSTSPKLAKPAAIAIVALANLASNTEISQYIWQDEHGARRAILRAASMDKWALRDLRLAGVSALAVMAAALPTIAEDIWKDEFGAKRACISAASVKEPTLTALRLAGLRCINALAGDENIQGSMWKNTNLRSAVVSAAHKTDNNEVRTLGIVILERLSHNTQVRGEMWDDER